MAPIGRRGKGRGSQSSSVTVPIYENNGSDSNTSVVDMELESDQITTNGTDDCKGIQRKSILKSCSKINKEKCLFNDLKIKDPDAVNDQLDESNSVECLTLEDSEQEYQPSVSKGEGTGKTTASDQTTTDQDSDIKFTLDDSEFAELDDNEPEDADVVEKPVQNNIEGEAILNENTMGKKVTAAAFPMKDNKKTPRSSSKKNKRKFGLEYIVVSLVTDAAGSSMRDSPHECVLCLPEQTFTATLLAKHIHSAQHLQKVMELQCPLLHKLHENTGDAAVLHMLLSQDLSEPTKPVKLLVVTASKLKDARSKIIAVIDLQKKSMQARALAAQTCSGAAVLESDQSDLRTTLKKIRGKRSLQLEQDETDSGVSAAKKIKLDGTQISKQDDGQVSRDGDGSSGGQKSILLVGDERVKEFCSGCSQLADSSDVICLPGADLQKILVTALVKMNVSYKVLIIVSVLNDFVTKGKDNTNHLRMVNPNVDELCKSVSRFSSKVRSLSPTTKIVFTIPQYIDFTQYSKRIRYLRQHDFARLEDFSCQIMRAFKQMHDNLRHVAKNFSFNLNITLRDPTKNVDTSLGRNVTTANLMQFYAGTLLDGYHLSRTAYARVAKDINYMVQKMVVQISAYSPKQRPNMIECWTDCDKIIIIGDHHTFKFETSAPADMVKNVRLITEKFAPMSVLLERADQLLNPSVDVLVIVGFYREFAQNVINGRYTMLEPKVPVKHELFALLKRFCKKWQARYPRLTVIFTIPQVVDFLKYNEVNNKDIYKSTEFCNQMNRFSHQFSINIMSFYKELRPALTLGSTSIWLYHITNSLFEGNESLLPTLGDFSTVPMFPPNSTFDGFKPNQATSFRMRADLVMYISRRFRKHPVQKHRIA